MFYKIGEVSKEIGINIATLRIWCKLGNVEYTRLISGHFVFTQEQFDNLKKSYCSEAKNNE